MRRGPRSFGSLIDGRSGGLGSEITAVRELLAIWSEVVGPELARRSWPQRAERETLWLGVDDSAWIQEIDFLAPEILQRLRERLPHLRCRRIRCRVTPATPPPPVASRPGQTRPPPRIRPDTLAQLRNPELVELATRLADMSGAGARDENGGQGG